LCTYQVLYRYINLYQCSYDAKITKLPPPKRWRVLVYDLDAYNNSRDPKQTNVDANKYKK
jgi:hypothetical protein